MHYIPVMQPLPLLTPRPPSALARLTLVLALVLGGALAWAVIAELRFQRRTAEKVTEDYLSLVARERVDGAAAALRSATVAAIGAQVSGTMGSVYEELPPPAPRNALASTLRCSEGGDSMPLFFRFDLRNMGFLVSPPDRAERIAWVQDVVASELRTSPASNEGFATLLSHGRALIYGVKHAPYSAPVAVYGLVTCASALSAVLAGAHARGGADSVVSLVATVGNDTLVGHTMPGSRVLAQTEDAGVRLMALPAFARPLSGVVIAREGVPSLALTLMLLGTIALASIAVLQLVRDRRAVRRQAELLTTISHELRTPLAQILLYSETLALDRVRGDDARRAAAQRIVDEANRLIDTVSTVVGLTRPERAVAAATSTPVAPVIETAITRVRALSDARTKIAVSVSGTPRARIGDAALLQALTNVLD
ncbi:MAG TPA: histidine kinase dimerization/phospho-acceptor domain-containing protein, partial [Gemmatimonadaceae bacterium]|nr:histidine kinase dimerization/phospho-acceptor domain-containing protein [Gemmatimonadaceae bacterium]